jgi:LacI family xylobiose transport system transcriptional regulator
VRQALAEMGEQAALLALDARDGSVRAARVDLATSLVVRDSTAPPPVVTK